MHADDIADELTSAARKAFERKLTCFSSLQQSCYLQVHLVTWGQC